MLNFPALGRVFYGLSIAGLGFLTLYYRDFPYFLIPPHSHIAPWAAIVISITGTLLCLAGISIVSKMNGGLVSLLLGGVLLLNFIVYFIPYQIMFSTNSRQFGDWENAAKVLALAVGAWIITGSLSNEKERGKEKISQKIFNAGRALYATIIVSFSMDHFLYAKNAVDYVPRWIPGHLFWIYFCGIALACSGVAILFQIKMKLAATLLGAMILVWVIILHIPYVVAASSPEERAGESASALLALAYCGTALSIAGFSFKESVNQEPSLRITP